MYTHTDTDTDTHTYTHTHTQARARAHTHADSQEKKWYEKRMGGRTALTHIHTQTVGFRVCVCTVRDWGLGFRTED